MNKIYKDKNVRSVVPNETTRSNDTKSYFEKDDPKCFAKTQWGVKLKDKLQRMQAGEKRDSLLRILAINFLIQIPQILVSLILKDIMII